MGNRSSVSAESCSSSSTTCCPNPAPTRHNTKYRIIGNGKVMYPLPNNSEEEKQWFEDRHYLFRYMWQCNFSAPIDEKLKSDDGIKVLDIGCNLGTWVLEMASAYPNSKFIGVDTVTSSSTKPNVIFMQTNVLDGLPFEGNSFDLIRISDMSYTEKDWENKISKELMRLTKPGGWIEILQTDARFCNCGPSSERWNDALLGHLRQKNINGSICERMVEMLLSTREISESNFSHEVVISPIGRWGKRPGEFGLSYFRELSKKMKSGIAMHLGITEQEYDKIVCNSEMEFDLHRSYSTAHRFIGQKN